MRKYPTKSLTSLTLASAVALPLIASCASTATNRMTNLKAQDNRDCQYEKNTEILVQRFIDSCIKETIAKKISKSDIVRQTRLTNLKRLALTDPDANQAYNLLTNRPNLKLPSEVPYYNESQRPKSWQ